MKILHIKPRSPWVLTVTVMAALLFAAGSAGARAWIDGISGPTSFNFTAGSGELSIADGGSVHFWGYQDLDNNEGVDLPQYPGPTLILDQGDVVTINLTSSLPFGQCTSMVFPGHTVMASGGNPGMLTQEACPGDAAPVIYSFTASEPGTYMYYSGTNQGLQIEMGLLGAIIVRPATATQAYNSADTSFDHEVLFLLTSIDPLIHQLAEQNRFAEINMAERTAVYWMINGRAAPDVLVDPFVPYLPHQPYNCTPRITPGQKILVRIIGGDLDQHPLHLHGNHYWEIARYGRLLSSNGLAPDLQRGKFTTLSVPGQTVDALFSWTGEKLGWDIYGSTLDGMPEHNCIDVDLDGYADAGSDYPMEWCADHNKKFPVVLPETQSLAFGGWWSGSPYMGGGEPLPPGEGGLNPHGGYFFMWHSHTEKELTNWDIFPGGMMTMMVVEPPGTPID
ncbi:multicopper oxidase domain-containing protein [Desulfocastanea catecholica]